MKHAPRSSCPISMALDILGDRWSLLIIRDIIFQGHHRYRDFLESAEGIATNILADRLRRLVDSAIVEHCVDREQAGAQAYRLTTKGLDLIPVLLSLARWGAEYECTGADDQALARLKQDPAGLEQELRARARPLDPC